MSSTKKVILTPPQGIYNELEERAKALGTSVHDVCKEISVPPQTINQWRKKDPKSITLLRKFEKHLDYLEAARPRGARPVRTSPTTAR